jgi:hypothetical protein
MPLKSRRGITLIDLLIALILVALLGLAMTRLLLVQRRSAGALLAGDEARRTLEQGAGWISAELAEVGKGDSNSDLLRLGRDSLTYRAWRMTGIACLVAGNEVRLRRDLLALWRMPQPGRDSLMLFMANDSFPGDGAWVTAPLNGVSESDCAGRPALRLVTQLDPARLPGMAQLVPVRSFEVMQLRLYRSSGEWWLGARSVSAGEGVQPLAGPFADRGIGLSYRDTLGLETVQPENVERLQLSLTPAGYLDSTRVSIAPRNLP